MSSARVRLCGLGAEPSEDATLEALQALGECETVFADLASPKSMAWLKRRCKVKAAPRRADDILKAAKTGCVGVAVWGHPLFTSELGRELVALCRRKGVALELFPGVGPIGVALARSASFLGGDEGCPGAQARSLRSLLKGEGRLDARLPLVVFAETAGPRDWAALSQKLLEFYPDGHELLVYPLPGMEERRLTLGALAREKLSGGVVVLGLAKALESDGSKLRALGQREEALEALRRTLVTTPDSPTAHAVLGEVLRELGGRRKGYAEIQKAVRLDPRASFARERLRGGAGRDEAWIFGCRGGGLRLANDFQGAREQLEKAVDLDPGCGWAWGWLGEVLMRLAQLHNQAHGAMERHERLLEALGALNRAIALFAEWPEVYVWRGECKRLLGRDADAGADLDQAVALGYREWDVFVNRAAVALAAGDAKRYEDEMREAVRAAPEVIEAEAKKSGDAEGGRWIAEALERIRGAEKLLAKAEKAGPGEAVALLGKALDLDAGCVKALALRSKLHQEAGRLNLAMEDADRAVKLSPSADAYAQRADLSQRLGFMEAALKDLSIAVALSPNAQLHQWRAQTFIGMRHYDLAIKETSAALELEPDNWYLYDLRAHINMLLGKLEPARDDVERALKISPRQANLHLRLGQNLALQRKFDEALASVEPIRAAFPAWARFIAGYVRCVERRYDLAMKEFDAALSGAGADQHLKNQSVIFGTVAKAMAAKLPGAPMKASKITKKSTEKTGKVYLCGLGVYPPQTATVEVLRALTECDVIFNNLPGVGMSEFLGLFCPNRRPVAFRYEQDAKLCADLVLSEAKPGRTVAFVTFGHPLLFGPLSNEIIQRCRKESIPCKAFGAVSSMDAVLAASGQVLGFSYGGFQLFESMGTGILEEIAKASSRLPLVIYFADGMSEEWLANLTKILTKNYRADYEVLFYGPRHELWETQQQKLTVTGLGATSHHKLAQGILFVPPEGSVKR